MGFFSSLVSSDDEKEVQLLTAFYYVLTSCAVAKAMDEQEAGIPVEKTKPLNTRHAVADLGLFKTIKPETEERIAEKTRKDILSNNFNFSSGIKTQMEIIKNSDSNAAKRGFATILKGFLDIAYDGNHEKFKNMLDYIIALLPEPDAD